MIALPKYFQQIASPPAGDIGLIDDFDDATAWKTYASGSSGDHQHELNTTQFKTGNGAIRFYQNTAGTIRRYLYNADGWDFSSADIFTMLLYCHEGADEDSITMFLGTGAEGTLSNYFSISLGATAAGNGRRGWTMWSFRRDQFSVGGGSPDWADINNIVLSINSLDADEAITVDALWFGHRSRSKILITFDDGHETQNAAAVEANSHGIPLALFPIESLIDGVNYLTTAQLETLVAAGNEVHGHASSNFYTQSDHGYADMVAAKRYSENFGRNCGQIISYPGGSFNPSVQEAARRAGYRAGRSIVGLSYIEGPPERYESLGNFIYEATAQGFADPFAIVAQNLNDGKSLNGAKGNIDTAIERGLSLLFYGHKIDAVASSDTWTVSDFAALCEYIEDQRNLGLCDTPGFTEFITGMGL